jgi:hypothetical protein
VPEKVWHGRGYEILGTPPFPYPPIPLSPYPPIPLSPYPPIPPLLHSLGDGTGYVYG